MTNKICTKASSAAVYNLDNIRLRCPVLYDSEGSEASRMKTALPLIAAVLASFLCFAPDQVDAAPAPSEPKELTFFDRIFNIPRSVLNSVNKNLNDNGVKCKDGSMPVDKDGKGTCHDNALGISKSAIDSVNELLNG